MQAEITTPARTRCHVRAGPDQLRLRKGTQQILWVFALLASSGNPQFSDTKSGRMGSSRSPGQAQRSPGR